MSQTAQQDADLSQDAYRNYPVGIRPPGTKDIVDIDGIQYNILEHQSNPRTGYQGTIYQRVDTGDIVVAHRGTEVDQGGGPLIKDALWTDGRMVASRVNPQAQEAIELTRHAVLRANEIATTKGHIPEVTVTGHSLGGTLAQISAHHFGLKGETFNAYGAASLGLGIPQGGNDMVNHVMASDFVSAASPQYGRVQLHASPKEVATLIGAGYDNNDRFVADVRAPGIAHAALLGTHGIHNFTNVDGDGRPDRSILADPNAEQRAEQYAPMFAKFRGEMSLARGAATAVTTHLTPGLVGYDHDRLQPATLAGAPGRREGVQLLEPMVVPPLPAYLRDGSQAPDPAPAHPMPARDVPRSDAPERMAYPPIPDYLRDADRTSSLDPVRLSPSITDRDHPGNARYQQALDAIERSPNIPPGTFADERLQQAAANLAFASLAGAERPQGGPNESLDRIDFVVFNKDRSGLIAGQGDIGDPTSKLAFLSAAQDNATTLTQASQQVQDTLMQQQTMAQAVAQQQILPTQDDLGPKGPRLS